MTYRAPNHYGIRDQHKLATSAARREFGYRAADKRIPYRIRLLSVTNTGDETVFEFTSQALRPLRYHYRLWRDFRAAQQAKANRLRSHRPVRWFYSDGSQAPEHILDRSPWYVRVSQGITGPVNIARFD